MAATSVKEKAVEDVIDDRGSDLSSENGNEGVEKVINLTPMDLPSQANNCVVILDPLNILNEEPIYTVPRNSFKNPNDNSSAVDPYTNMAFSQSIPLKSNASIPSY